MICGDVALLFGQLTVPPTPNKRLAQHEFWVWDGDEWIVMGVPSSGRNQRLDQPAGRNRQLESQQRAQLQQSVRPMELRLQGLVPPRPDGRNSRSGVELSSYFFSPDGKKFVAVTDEWNLGSIGGYTTQIWDAESGKELKRWEHLAGLNFSPDSRKIITQTYSGKMPIIFDVESGRELQRLNTSKPRGIESAKFSPDGRRIVVDGFGGPMLFDSESGKQLAKWKEMGDSFIDFSPNGEKMLFSSYPGSTLIIDTESGKQLDKIDGGGLQCFSPDGNKAVFSSFNPDATQVFDLESETEKELLRLPFRSSKTEFSSDGKRILVTNPSFPGGFTQIWDVESGRALQKFEDGFSSFCRLSPDGKKIVVNDRSNPDNPVVQIYDVESGKQLHKWFGEFAGFSPDGRKIAIFVSTPSPTVHIWTLE